MKRIYILLLLIMVGCGGKATNREIKRFAFEEGMKQHAPSWSQTLPQRKDAKALYEAATPITGEPLSALLLCKFNFPETVTIHGTVFVREGRLDPMVIVEAPDGARFSHRFGFNLQEVYLSVPLVDLKTGGEWSMHIYDQGRITDDDWVASLKASYQGKLPFVFAIESPKIEIECRALERDATQTLVDAASTALTARSTTASALAVKPSLPDAGLKDAKLLELMQAAAQMAALVGWQDPTVQAQVKSINTLLAQWDEKLKATLPHLGEATSLPSLSGVTVGRQPSADKNELPVLIFENTGADELAIATQLFVEAQGCALEPAQELRPPKVIYVGSRSWYEDKYITLKPKERRTINYYLGSCQLSLAQEARPRLLFIETAKLNPDASATLLEATLFWLP